MKALVLCAGMGSRLKDLTLNTPKPMLPIAGKPILQYHLELLKQHGFEDILINTHFHAEAIQDFFSDGSNLGVKIQYSYEKELLGTAGALSLFKTELKHEEACLVYYGDILTNQNLEELIQTHTKKKSYATLLLHQRKKSNSIIELNCENRIVNFLERPKEDEVPENLNREHCWVNSGIQILSQKALQDIWSEKPFDLPKDLYVQKFSDEAIYGLALSGYRFAIDSKERYEEAEEYCQSLLEK